MIDGTDGNKLTKALERERRAKDDFLELLQSIGRAKKAGHVTGDAQREERKRLYAKWQSATKAVFDIIDAMPD
jgi:hypothetical protein